MIKKIIETTLPALAAEKGSADLGDRSKYIGASDVGQCPRKAIMGKLFPQPISLEQQIVFERGHLAENIVHESLLEYCDGDDTKSVLSQYEVAYSSNKNIKAHIDFVLNEGNKQTVVEVKTATMVNTPYDSWINQCIFQQGLLALQNPEAEIDGFVLVIDLKTGNIGEFKVKFDEVVFNDLLNKAIWLLQQLSASDIDYDNLPLKPSVLCGYCGFQEGCPYYDDKSNISDDLRGFILEYAQINGQIKELDKSLGQLEETIKSHGEFRTTIEVKGEGDKPSFIKASFGISKMTTLNIQSLKQNEPELYAMYSQEKEVARLVIK